MDTTTLPCPRRGGTALGGSQEDCGQARTAGRWGLPQAGCREALECEKLKACPRLHTHKWMFSLLLSETAPTARSLEGGGGRWGGREATVRAGPQPLAVRGCRPELGGEARRARSAPCPQDGFATPRRCWLLRAAAQRASVVRTPKPPFPQRRCTCVAWREGTRAWQRQKP